MFLSTSSELRIERWKVQFSTFTSSSFGRGGHCSCRPWSSSKFLNKSSCDSNWKEHDNMKEGCQWRTTNLIHTDTRTHTLNRTLRHVPTLTHIHTYTRTNTRTHLRTVGHASAVSHTCAHTHHGTREPETQNRRSQRDTSRHGHRPPRAHLLHPPFLSLCLPTWCFLGCHHRYCAAVPR